MGLDNIPRDYPCQRQGTAVLVDGKIDCDATMGCGACPWKNAAPTKGAVYGILGAPCWYRGKYGAALLATLGRTAAGDALYGDDNGIVSPDTLREIASVVVEIKDSFGGRPILLDGEDETASLDYLAWWCEFAADECDGAVAWY